MNEYFEILLEQLGKIPGNTKGFSVPVIPDGLEGALHYGN